MITANLTLNEVKAYIDNGNIEKFKADNGDITYHVILNGNVNIGASKDNNNNYKAFIMTNEKSQKLTNIIDVYNYIDNKVTDTSENALSKTDVDNLLV